MLRTLEGHTGWVKAVAVSPGGRWIVSGSDDNTLKIWQMESGVLPHTLKADVPFLCLAFAPSGDRMIAGDTLGGVHILKRVRYP